MNEHRDPLRERFHALARGTDDSDWADVEQRAGRRNARPWVLAAAATVGLLALLAVPAIGLGLGGGLPFFQGKRAPERVVEFFGNFHRGFPSGMDPGVIENQTRQVLDVKVAGGVRAVLWVAPTHGQGFCQLLEFAATSGGGCVVHPIGFNPGIWYADSMSPPAALVNGTTDVPDARRVEVEFADGATAKVPLVWVSRPIDAAFFVYGIPRAHWYPGHTATAIVVRDADGHELARTPFHLTVPRRYRNGPTPPYRRAGEQPLQQGDVPGVVLDVYRSGLVHVRFTPHDGGPYAFLLPKVQAAARHTVTVECGDVAFGHGRWSTRFGGTYAEFGLTLQAVVPTPSPPYDACSVRGHYGRRWDEHVGYHNAVEVPFDAEAERFFAEQAAARRLAYFVRSPKMHAIRKALKAGDTAPSSKEIASRFDESVVALESRDAMPPPGKIGVWSGGSQTIVAAERADDGRRMYVTLDRGRIGAHDLDELAFVF
jgi:hypothetical protein